MSTKNIALIAGGFTGEYEVSINSARNIAENLDPAKYKVYTVLITRADWFYDTWHQHISIDKNRF